MGGLTLPVMRRNDIVLSDIMHAFCVVLTALFPLNSVAQHLSASSANESSAANSPFDMTVSAAQGSRVIVDPENPSWLIYESGAPLFIAGVGDPEGFLYRGELNDDGTRDGDQLDFIRRLADHGGNGVYVQAVRSHGGDGEPTHNPWVDNRPSAGLNENVFQQWDEWFTEMSKHRILVHFFIYDDAINVSSRFGWDLDATGELHPGEKAFVQALVNRFKHLPNIVWVVMEEGQEVGLDWQAHISKVGEAIAEVDDQGHVIATHQLGGNVFAHPDDPHIDQFAMQGDASKIQTAQALHDWIVDAWNQADGRYSLNMAEDPLHLDLTDSGNRDGVRLRSWAAAMPGAYVLVYGMDIVDTPVEQLGDLRRMQNFFEATRINRMEPRDDLAFGGTAYVLAEPGTAYVAYSPSATSYLGLRGLIQGTCSLTWFDPATGSTFYNQEVSVPGGEHSWTPPEGVGAEVACTLSAHPKALIFRWKSPSPNAKMRQWLCYGKTSRIPFAHALRSRTLFRARQPLSW